MRSGSFSLIEGNIKPHTDDIYDFIGIGIGPFNLGLACLAQPIDELRGLFLEQKSEFNWHPGMLLENVRLQTPFMADLVTMADPTSPFSFLNYAKQNGRLYQFCIRENFFLLRQEYNFYCRWVIDQLSSLKFDTEVTHIDYLSEAACYRIQIKHTKSGRSGFYFAKRLVLGTGTQPSTPAFCNKLHDQFVHSAKYIHRKNELLKKNKIAVVGSGQSAAEIFYDLLQAIDQHNYELHWYTRAAQFSPMDYTKLSLEMTSPDYLEYFYHLPHQQRHQLIKQQAHLYKGINADLINSIYDLLYVKHLTHSGLVVNLHTNSSLDDAFYNPSTQQFRLDFFHQQQHQAFSTDCDALILATGYEYHLPRFLNDIKKRIVWEESENNYVKPKVSRNYSIDQAGGEIFAQNLGLDSHGFITPDVSMAAYRNASIINTILGHTYYSLEQNIAFQCFSAPDDIFSIASVRA
ncbi:MAG: alcaligin biosynthesis protein [Gammaproteobacteria bacterium]|nr:MAG: alcaligin biosynthesis protein [Gammaproteobacteria bacterium]